MGWHESDGLTGTSKPQDNTPSSRVCFGFFSPTRPGGGESLGNGGGRGISVGEEGERKIEMVVGACGDII